MHEDGNNFHKLWMTTAGNLSVEIRYQKLKVNFNYCFRHGIFQNQVRFVLYRFWKSNWMSLRDSHCTNLDRLCRICGNLLGKKVLAKEKYITQLNNVLFINITNVLFINITTDLQYYILPRYASNAVFLWIWPPREIYITIFHLKHIKTSVPMITICTVSMKG